jgi:lipocalin
MKYFCLFICLICSFTLFSQSHKIALEALQGKWFIHFSNFPMWLKGNKTQPTFNYSIAKKGDIIGLKDSVRFLKKGKQRSIVGFDKPKNTMNTQFVWRGQGLLVLFKSEWSVLYVDPTNNWAVIGFTKTLFTPAGYDVIAKNKEISADFEQIVGVKLKELNISETLKRVKQGE